MMPFRGEDVADDAPPAMTALDDDMTFAEPRTKTEALSFGEARMRSAKESMKVDSAEAPLDDASAFGGGGAKEKVRRAIAKMVKLPRTPRQHFEAKAGCLDGEVLGEVRHRWSEKIRTR